MMIVFSNLVFHKRNKCGNRVQMQTDLDTSMRLGADAWTHGKQFVAYILNYLEETDWFVPLDDVMRPDDDDDNGNFM